MKTVESRGGAVGRWLGVGGKSQTTNLKSQTNPKSQITNPKPILNLKSQAPADLDPELFRSFEIGAFNLFAIWCLRLGISPLAITLTPCPSPGRRGGVISPHPSPLPRGEGT